ncbi:MAG: hypothetical protein WD623_10410 [Marinobacter sp.]|uniref:hypothetical protein n=1 Tax=Marinobacter sp. TaxID=50741 RepID=UPI00349FEA2A
MALNDKRLTITTEQYNRLDQLITNDDCKGFYVALLAIARALLKRPQILIFDEATSALDAATAEQFAQTVNKLRGKMTPVFITHLVPRGLVIDKHLTHQNEVSD